MFIGAIFCFALGHYMLGFYTLVIIFISSLPMLVGKRFHLQFPTEFEFIAVGFIFATLYLGNIQDFYNRFWWWDKLLHGSSGVILGILGFNLIILVKSCNRTMVLTPFFSTLFAFLFAITLGTIWEIFEFTMDEFFELSMQKSSLEDTMWDLIMDTAGALSMTIFGYNRLIKSESNS